MSTKTEKLTNLPRIVSRAEWQQARDQLLVKEKAATRAHDALAAERRRLPMVRIEKEYVFDGLNGKTRLLELFEGRPQLIIYHFMFAPSVDGWPSAGCPGCSMVVDYIGPIAHLHGPATLPWRCSHARRSPVSRPISDAWVGTCRGIPQREEPLQRRLRPHDRRADLWAECLPSLMARERLSHLLHHRSCSRSN